VSLMVGPGGHVALSQMQALASDGRCKTFDAAADGYGRGEGAGMVLLKRLADAERDGDRVLALLVGSAVNHDGASSGLTVPNRHAQEQVVRAALGQAGVAPARVGYVEAHGTGTPLGDPIELRALGAVYGEERHDALRVGSVKTNIGHLEAAAGVAGVIKAVLMVQHGVIPAHLHFNTPNPYVVWEELAVTIPTRAEAWEGAGRIAGVSAFGMSGTNAHVLVAAAPERADVVNGVERPLHLLTLSAKNERALADYAARYATWLEAYPEVNLGDVSSTSHVGRSHFAHRMALVAGSVAELQARLAEASSSDAPRFVLLRSSLLTPLPSLLAWPSSSPGRARSTPGWARSSTRPSRPSGRRSTAVLSSL